VLSNQVSTAIAAAEVMAVPAGGPPLVSRSGDMHTYLSGEEGYLLRLRSAAAAPFGRNKSRGHQACAKQDNDEQGKCG
jgi:hypothetical protein